MNRWNSFLELPLRRPKLVITLIAIFTLVSLGLLVKPGLKLDPTPYPLSESHPAMKAYRQLKADYTGTLESALVLLVHKTSVYNPGTLERVKGLSDALRDVNLLNAGDGALLKPFAGQVEGEPGKLIDALAADGNGIPADTALMELQSLLSMGELKHPGVKGAVEELLLRRYPVSSVTSLSTVEDLRAEDGQLRVGRYYESTPGTPEALEALRTRVSADVLLRDLMVSRDGTATGIIVETNIPDHRSELHMAMARRIEALLTQIPGDETAFIAGTPVLAATGLVVMEEDNTLLFPVIFTLVVLLLWATLRSLGGIVLPLAVVMLSVVWTLALKVLFNVPLNQITTSLPVFLFTVGIADGIHIISEFRDQFRALGDRILALRATLKQMWLPVVMTSVTTAAGFLSLAYTDLKMIRNFGLFVAIGTMLALVFSLWFVPAGLALGGSLFKDSAGKGKVPSRFGSLLARLDAWTIEGLLRLSRFSLNRAGWVVLTGALVAIASLFFMTRIQAENDFLTYFEEDMPIIVATKAMDTHMAGSLTANLVITAAGEEPFKDPRRLAQVGALQAFLEKQKIVGKTFSLVDLLKRINQSMHNDDPAYFRLPAESESVEGNPGAGKVAGRDLVAQYLLLYGNGGGENLTDVADSRFASLNVQVMLSTRNTKEIGALLDSMNGYVAANFPPDMKVTFGGAAHMITASNSAVVDSQVFSLASSLAVVFLLLLVQFLSPVKALLGMIPLGFAVLINFGMMGLLGIRLNAGTAIVSSVVIGVGVDFAIHYLSRLQTELARYGHFERAIDATLHSSGKAISANALVVAVGFSVLVFSRSTPMQQAGLMIGQTLLVSALATLTLLPAAMAFFRPAFARLPSSPSHPVAVEEA
ncbi:MAG: MMPL family transporter [Deltaproteobacteria bacterium]|nr:MMPL family transporter [Deltaproteobacteria bacterium]